MTLKATKTTDDIVRELNKQYGDLFSSGRIPPKDTIPFSDPYLTYVTKGGIRYGASSEIVGGPSAGKTTLAMDLIGNAQKIEKERYEKRKKELKEEIKNTTAKKKKAELEAELSALKPRLTLMADIEGTYTARWAQKHGVNIDELKVLRPMPAGSDVMLDFVVDLASTGEYGVILVDSIGVMLAEAEFDSHMGKGNFGGIAKILTKFYKKINPYLLQYDIALIMINQTRHDMAGFNRLVRPGGAMNEFVQSLTLYLTFNKRYNDRWADAKLNDPTLYAKETRVRIEKNKAASGDVQNAQFTIRMDHGVDREKGLIDLMMFKGSVVQSGSWYSMFDPKTGEELIKTQGISGLHEKLLEEQELVDRLCDYYYEESISELGAMD